MHERLQGLEMSILQNFGIRRCVRCLPMVYYSLTQTLLSSLPLTQYFTKQKKIMKWLYPLPKVCRCLPDWWRYPRGQVQAQQHDIYCTHHGLFWGFLCCTV